MEQKLALIAGATGLVGSELLKILLKSEDYSILHSLVRKPSGIQNLKLKEFVVDFDKLDEYTDAFKANDVFCCLGTTIKKAGSQEAFKKVDVDYVVNIANLANKSGAEKFAVISSMGADAKSKIFYNRMKGLMEKGVSESGIKSVVIVRPSLLLGNRKEARFGEKAASVLSKPFMFLFSGPFRKYRPIKAETVAAAMLNFCSKQNTGVNIFSNDKLGMIK